MREEVPMFPFLVSLGVLAGALTTVAGVGGGILLVLALSFARTPQEALALTSPALLLGGLHRLYLHRREVDRRIAIAFSVGAFPGSLLGGALVPALPAGALRALLVVATVLGVGRALQRGRGAAPRSTAAPAGHPRGAPRGPATAALIPAGFGISALAGTTGSAGLLLGPLLISSGLTGGAYVGTSAAASVSMHLGRILAYGAGGLITPATLSAAAVLTAAIVAGNLLGERVRRHVGAELGARIEIGVLMACVALALGGMA
jgi:hypothetical protein